MEKASPKFGHTNGAHFELVGCLSFAAAYFLVSCGGGSIESTSQMAGNQLQNPEALQAFTGVQAVEKSQSGFWTVKWKPIPDDQTVYSIYKANNIASIDFDAPFTTTQGDTYVYLPEKKFGSGSLCFAVRIANVSIDKNTKSICGEDSKISFDGAESLTRLADGSYILNWNKINVDNVVYAIYERNIADQYTFNEASYDGIQTEFFSKLNPVERGSQYCYIVRYSHPDLPPDSNTKEICTELEEPIIFQGIADLQSVGPGAIKATWLQADRNIVKGYRIYQGSDFRELVAKVGSDSTETIITGLVPGRQYNIGVRAVDQFQREDRNIRIRAIVIPNP